MTERYVKVSELEALADVLKYERVLLCRQGKGGTVEALLLKAMRTDLRSLIATAQPREVDEAAEREAFEMWAATPYPLDRTVPWLKQAGDGGYWNEKVDDAWMVWKAAKRHERGEG